MTLHRAQFLKAFTLIEALLASVVLAATVAAMTVPFVTGARNEQDNARRTQAVALAQEMMEEILSKPFYDDNTDYRISAGPEPGETNRAAFDNMDDYHNYVEAAGAIADRSGAVVTDAVAAGLTRRVTTSYVYVSGQDTLKPPSFLRVTVELSREGQTIVKLSRLVYGLEQ